MADKKITQLTNITGANLADADEFVVVDITADETKAITFSELKTAFDTGTGFVRVTGDTMTGALNVESTITADGLTVDGTNGISVNGSYAVVDLVESDITDNNTRLITSGGDFRLDTINDAKSTSTKRLTVDHATGDISFYEDTGTTAKFFWDSSTESLGIGTSSPSSLLQLSGSPVATSGALATFRNSDATASNTSFGGVLFNSSPGTDYSIGKSNVNAVTTLSFRNGNTGVSYMDITSTGRVGIGTDSPTGLLHLKGDTNSNGSEIYLQVNNNNTTDNLGAIHFGNNIDSTLSKIVSGTSGANNSSYLTFSTSSTGTQSESMRIDSSGNLLVGKSTIGIANVGGELRADGQITGTKDGGAPLALNRKTSNGDIALFQKDGATVGSIQSRAGVVSTIILDPRSGSIGTGITGSGANLSPTNGSGVEVDARNDLGKSDYRFKDLYLSGTAKINQLRLENNGSTTSGLFHEKDITGSGTSTNLSVFAETGKNINFMTNGSVTKAMTIDSSGNLLVGKTTTALATAGITLGESGFGSFTRSGFEPLNVNRLSSDGDIAVFYKDGTTVGSIGVGDGDNLYISGHAGSTKGLYFNNDTVGPATNGYTFSDNTTNLGAPTVRFKDAYLSGGVYLGGTTAANKLEDYEEGTFTPTLQNVTVSYSDQQGTYTKIGNVVTLRFEIGVTGLNTSDGSAFQIGGFPFTVSASGCLFTMDTENSNVLTNKPLIIGARPNVNHTSLRLLKNNTEYSYNSGTNSSGSIIGMIKYFTNQ